MCIDGCVKDLGLIAQAIPEFAVTGLRFSNLPLLRPIGICPFDDCRDDRTAAWAPGLSNGKKPRDHGEALELGRRRDAIQDGYPVLQVYSDAIECGGPSSAN